MQGCQKCKSLLAAIAEGAITDSWSFVIGGALAASRI